MIAHRRAEKKDLEVDLFMIQSAVRARTAAELKEMQLARHAELREAAAARAAHAEHAADVPIS